MVLEVFVRVAVYRPLESKRANRLLLMLASLGFYIAFQNGISLIAGDSGRFLRPGVVEAGLKILGGRITQTQLITVIFSIAVAIVLGILQSHTRSGRILKAVADDSQLADMLGIQSKLWVSAGHAIAGGLAGLTGVFWALNVDFSPAIGMNAFMFATVAVIVGGAGSLGGVAGGTVLVALVSQLAVWKLGSQWQYAMTFLILLAFLLFCPKGLSGKPFRKSHG
jgi:branched-subunit amino acid ABC-type transport system permease component